MESNDNPVDDIFAEDEVVEQDGIPVDMPPENESKDGLQDKTEKQATLDERAAARAEARGGASEQTAPEPEKRAPLNTTESARPVQSNGTSVEEHAKANGCRQPLKSIRRKGDR